MTLAQRCRVADLAVVCLLPPPLLPTRQDEDTLPVNSAWSNLGAQPAAVNNAVTASTASASAIATAPIGGSDKLWDDFKTKEAEQRRKEKEKEAVEAQRRAEREEELAVKRQEVEEARKTRQEHEERERREKREEDERERQRIEDERRRAREARDQDEAAMADDDKSQDELRRLERLAR